MWESLWLSMEPETEEVRMSLQSPGIGTVLRARLPVCPRQPRALATFLESLAAWYGRPLVAVLDADAEDVRRHGERWARLMGDLSGGNIDVEWRTRPSLRRRDRFLGKMGGFRKGVHRAEVRR